MKILLTGGAGYIGSHTAISLLEQGHEVIIVDNLSNSKKLVVDRVEEISGKKVSFYEYDVRDKAALDSIFSQNKVDAVIHFAGLKAVGESVSLPLKYYENNLVSTLSLIQSMEDHHVDNLVFSSSATVYGSPASLPITEDFPLSTTNPYGTTKLMIERIIEDYCAVHPDFSSVILRYFNPVGAHKSGLIGEDPKGIPNNIFPYITQVAVGKLERLGVFGDDFPTVDGSGVRDYMHVVDLAEGHAAALKVFEEQKKGVNVYNLGTGKGTSVLELVKSFEEATGRAIPYEIMGRRAGDIAACYADCSKAEKELGWKTKLGIKEMCQDAWRWQEANPNGYD